jgi:serine/threonine protein kinase
VSVSERAKNLIRSMLQSKPDMRPTLNEVQNHAFFTHRDVRIPLTLPDNATTVAPVWRINSKDEIVVVPQPSSSSSSSSSHSTKEPREARQPLATKDSNARSSAAASAAPSKPAAAAPAPAAEGRVTRSRAKAQEQTGKDKDKENGGKQQCVARARASERAKLNGEAPAV